MILGLTKKIIVVDAETSSAVDLKKHGAARYWADQSTRVLMLSFKEYGSDQCYLWQPHLRAIPKVITEAALLPPDECMFGAYNASFDYEALEKIGVHTPKEKWIDLMTIAYILAFAGGLDAVLKQYEVKDQYGKPLRKNPDGKRLITKFSKQQTPWYDDPDGWHRFCNYCIDDTMVETELFRKCLAVLDKPVFYPMIRQLQDQWLMNQRINAHGIPVCLKTINGAMKIQKSEIKRLLERTKQITGLSNPNSVQQLQGWMADHHYDMDNLQAANVRDCLDDPEMPEEVAEMLSHRLSAGRQSVKKFGAMLDRQVDGRIHGSYTLLGASRTGRDASRGLNLTNLERPKLEDIDLACWVVEGGNADLFKVWLDAKDASKEPLEILGSCVRGTIKAPEGYGITAVDLKSIESVGSAFLAGDTIILDMFHSGKDTYKDFATRYYKISYEEVSKAQRTYCKPAVLGCSYGASGLALVKYAKKLNIVLEENDAAEMVKVFRESFHEIPLMWRNLEKAAKNAIRSPGQTFYAFACDTFSPWGEAFHTYKKWPYVSYYYDSDTQFLQCGIPSGRTLFYYKPEILQRQMRGKRKGPNGEPTYYFTDSIHYWGKETEESGAWRFISSWGGGLFENVVQAMCRDILFAGLEKIDRDPLISLIGSVYDECICLTRLDDPGCFERIRGYMTEKLPWMDDGFFLDGNGYCNVERYRKD
jgi:DNA polymerase